MAVSPTIPTSFVPKQPLDTPRRKMQPGDNIMLLGALLILGVSVVTAGAVFGYQHWLKSVIEVKTEALAQARAEIDERQVEELIRLQERFISGRELLDDHITASRFLTLLESVTLQNVRFDTMELLVADDRSATVSLSGAARNFNTLAAQSNEIAAQRDFKRAIFSEITLNTTGSVNFKLTAALDPSLIRMQKPAATAAPTEEVAPEAPPPAAEAQPVATTTATTPATTTPGL